MIYQNFIISIVEKPDPKLHGGYRYLIEPWGGSMGYAFKTEKGYKRWVERTNLQIRHAEDKQTTEYGLIRIFHAIGLLEERLFQNLSEIPPGAVRYKGVSNGSVVDCYYLKTEFGSIEFHPNPNFKDIYKPLPIEEHIKFHKMYG